MTLANLENMTQKDKQLFEQAVNKLLSDNFVVKQNENTKADYYFIERHEDLVKQFLAYAGWQLDGEKSYGVYAVCNKQGRNRRSLKLVESIIVLIIRLIFEEKRKEISLSNQIVIRVQELQDRYLALKIRQKPLGKTELRDTLRLLRKTSILEVLEGDAADPETRLLIYPSILYAVRVENIEEIYAKITTYQDKNKREGVDK